MSGCLDAAQTPWQALWHPAKPATLPGHDMPPALLLDDGIPALVAPTVAACSSGAYPRGTHTHLYATRTSNYALRSWDVAFDPFAWFQAMHRYMAAGLKDLVDGNMGILGSSVQSGL